MQKEKSFWLKDWSYYLVKEKDSKRFLNGQLTNDVTKVRDYSFEISTRLSRSGNLKFYLYLSKINDDQFFIMLPSHSSLEFKEDLEKFIIMDEVEIEEGRKNLIIKFGTDISESSSHKLNFLGKIGEVIISDDELSPFPLEDLKELSFFYGLPSEKNMAKESFLISQSPLVDRAVSFTKGCYIGQEVVNKIENNRGAGKKEALIRLSGIKDNDLLDKKIFVENEEYDVESFFQKDEELFIKFMAKRHLRVEEKEITIGLGEKEFPAQIHLLPYEEESFEDIAQQSFEKGVSFFTEGNNEKAKAFLERAFSLDSNNSDIVESLGVLEGRLGNYKRAIGLMDHLELIAPKSVMPYTNRSLYYMKLGDIEKAEDEKSKATLKSFELEANKVKEAKERDLLRRKNMYEQVLEIDSVDEMANLGLAEIYLQSGDLNKSDYYVETLIESNNKNFKALLLKAKIKLALKENELACSLLEKVRELSAEKGDFKLVSEAESILQSLKDA